MSNSATNRVLQKVKTRSSLAEELMNEMLGEWDKKTPEQQEAWMRERERKNHIKGKEGRTISEEEFHKSIESSYFYDRVLWTQPAMLIQIIDLENQYVISKIANQENYYSTFHSFVACLAESNVGSEKTPEERYENILGYLKDWLNLLSKHKQ